MPNAPKPESKGQLPVAQVIMRYTNNSPHTGFTHDSYGQAPSKDQWQCAIQQRTEVSSFNALICTDSQYCYWQLQTPKNLGNQRWQIIATPHNVTLGSGGNGIVAIGHVLGEETVAFKLGKYEKRIRSYDSFSLRCERLASIGEVCSYGAAYVNQTESTIIKINTMPLHNGINLQRILSARLRLRKPNDNRILYLQMPCYKQRFFVAYQIIQRLIEIHANGLIHCDLKPGNIVCGLDGESKLMTANIVDYDNAVECEKNDAVKREHLLGTVGFVPKEVLITDSESKESQQRIYSQKSDFFALGIILFRLGCIVGPNYKPGYFKLFLSIFRNIILQNYHYTNDEISEEEFNQAKLAYFKKIKNLIKSFELEYEDKISPLQQKLLPLLAENPEDRPDSLNEILNLLYEKLDDKQKQFLNNKKPEQKEKFEVKSEAPQSQPASPETPEGGRGTTDEDTAARETKKEPKEKKLGFWARQKQRWNGWNRWQKGFAIFGLVAAVAAVAATAYFTLAAAGAITVAAVIAHALPCSTGVAAAGSAGATGYGICLFGAANKTNSGARPPRYRYIQG